MFRWIITISLLSISFLACSSALSSDGKPSTLAGSQTPAAVAEPAQGASPQREPAAIPFPVLPVIAHYEFVPHYFMQWLNDHPRYTRIEAAVNDSQPPLFNLTLTEKASDRRVTYSNDEARVKALAQSGQEAKLTKIDYRTTNNFGQLPSHEFGFTDEHGQAVRWRFTLAAPVSERGAGLTEQGGGAGLTLIYRELGTAAGEGTTVQIGDKVSEAELWPEISAPPYFVAYRGAYSDGIGIGGLFAGRENWRVAAAPKELTEGAAWTLTNEKGQSRKLRLTAKRGEELTLVDAEQNLTLLARKTATGLAWRSITFADRSKTMRIGFSPEFDPATSSSAPVNFHIDLNGHNKIAHGSLTAEKRDATTTLRWQFKAPDWAKTRALTSTVTLNDNGYKLEVK